MIANLLLLNVLVLNSSQVFWSFLGLGAAVALLIWGFKHYWAIQYDQYIEAEPISTSILERKYAPFQAQPHALSIRLLSVLVAVAMVLVVLAWTPLQQHLYAELDMAPPISEAVMDMPVTTQEPPKSTPPSPPPLPPPSHLIQIAPDPEPPLPIDPVEPSPPVIPTTGPYDGSANQGRMGIVIHEEPEPVRPPEPTGPIEIAEVMPRFPGCEDNAGDDNAKKMCADQKLLAYIYDNIRYPDMAREAGVEGMAVVSFVVNEKGQISDIELLRDPGAGTGQETIRVIRLMQKLPQQWTPGKQRGRSVAVRYKLPVRFRLGS